MKLTIEFSDKTLNQIVGGFRNKETGKQCTIEDIDTNRLKKYLEKAIPKAVNEHRETDEYFDVGIHNLISDKFVW